MYSPSYNQLENRAELLEFMRDNGFPLLVTGTGGTLHASHLPSMVHERDNEIVLDMHMARSNPQWKEFFDDEVMVVFSGPHAYVSPAWHRSSGVPTWNYAVVHVYGMARLIEEQNRLAALVQRLTAVHEAGQAEPRTVDFPEDRMKLLLGMIVGIEIEISQIQGKFKLSQNRPVEDRAEVVRQLREGSACCGVSLADLMEAT